MQRHDLRRLLAIGLSAAALTAPSPAQGLYTAPIESRQALENLLPAADLVARARYGDDGPGGVAELGLGNLAAPFSALADVNWNSGQNVPLRLTYDGFGRAALTVGDHALVYDTPGGFEALAISARAKGAFSQASLYGVTINGQPLAKGAKAYAAGAATAFDGTLVLGASLRNGFVLRGTLRLMWSTPPSAPGALLVELRAGRLAPQMERGCTSTRNSTGLPARIDWWGVTSVSSNKLGLSVQDAPPGVAALFLVGGTQQSLPYGNGTLCVGPPIERLADPVVLDAQGRYALPLDLDLGPLGTGVLSVQPGDTRVFQVWFRDPDAGVDAFDLSDSLTATFLP
ncbi:MAG TPA: choice-of-anchor W domain-containing protein [Planctomycetota bacterium]|nr:choice-of-anchor W domain-containing protein [Planctomycetota bacterium]